MTISDEKLSAFLDAELPEQDMQAIREALASDAALSDRLAELAVVDSVVSAAYSTIDEQALPESVAALLKPPTEKRGRILAFAPLRKLTSMGQAPTAIAASIALVFGIGIGQLIPGNDVDQWGDISAALEHSPSGIEQQLRGGRFKPRLSYINQAGDYCRQFQWHSSERSEQSIACRENATWQLKATVIETYAPGSNEYQTASGGTALDTMLDNSIAQGPFDQQQEAAAINSGWKKP